MLQSFHTKAGRKLRGTRHLRLWGYMDPLASDTKDLERRCREIHLCWTHVGRDDRSICDMLAEPAIL